MSYTHIPTLAADHDYDHDRLTGATHAVFPETDTIEFNAQSCTLSGTFPALSPTEFGAVTVDFFHASHYDYGNRIWRYAEDITVTS
ncbi:hypothetical protein J6590_015343 [Homalodisca vitripennis]|nr:hypothetical protein J6590_015343 [Homalodisca vitripennis]